MAFRKIIEVVGSLNIDLVTVTPRVPGPGETLTASTFSTGFGGKGANQAVACARLLRTVPGAPPELGIRVRMIGAVGSDQFGIDFRGHLEGEGIDVGAVLTKPDLTTGTAVILVEEQTGENRILITPSANGAVKEEDISFSTGQGFVILQLEIPLPVVIAGLRQAKNQGKTTVFNPAPAIPLPDEIWHYVDHLIVNESEAALLSNVPQDLVVDRLPDVASYFHKNGVAVVLITLGSKGVYWSTNGVGPGSNGTGMISARNVHVVDTTAAGDTFVGAYVVSLARQSTNDVRSAVEFANFAASLSVQKRGAQSAIPFLGKLLEARMD